MLRIVIALLVAFGALMPTQAMAANGQFFDKTGFRITDDDGISFWSEFQRLGGVDALGYPISRRFQWKGFTVQAMQKGVLQWRPEVGRAWLTNVFDEMGEAGKDEFLEKVRSTPRPLPGSFDAGKDWGGVIKGRQALLDTNPAIKVTYFGAADPMTFFGLPTSTVQDMGNHFAIRLQRAVIQQWKQDVPWARAGQVTVANGADIAKEAGLFPADVLRQETASGADVAPSAPAKPAAPQPVATALPAPAGGASEAQATVDRVNHYRGLMGLPPLRLDSALNQAAQSHANYYQHHHAGMAGMGLHYQEAGKPGYTGQEWGARARAAGWKGGSVDENVGLLGDGPKTVDAFMDTINHRYNLLHPSAVAFGYGVSHARPIDVMNIGFASDARPTTPAVYPAANQQGLPLSSGLWETPDPAPGIPRPVGYPITAAFGQRSSVEWGQPSLVDGSGQSVDVAVSTKAWLRGQSIVPKAPLKAGTTYRATVRGKVDGKPFEHSWTFATR